MKRALKVYIVGSSIAIIILLGGMVYMVGQMKAMKTDIAHVSLVVDDTNVVVQDVRSSADKNHGDIKSDITELNKSLDSVCRHTVGCF